MWYILKEIDSVSYPPLAIEFLEQCCFWALMRVLIRCRMFVDFPMLLTTRYGLPHIAFALTSAIFTQKLGGYLYDRE